jgi:hypothetical protein
MSGDQNPTVAADEDIPFPNKGRPHGEVAAEMLMEAADYIAGTLPRDIDPRAWRALLTYAPAEEVWRRLHRENRRER